MRQSVLMVDYNNCAMQFSQTKILDRSFIITDFNNHMEGFMLLLTNDFAAYISLLYLLLRNGPPIIVF